MSNQKQEEAKESIGVKEAKGNSQWGVVEVPVEADNFKWSACLRLHAIMGSCRGRLHSYDRGRLGSTAPYVEVVQRLTQINSCPFHGHGTPSSSSNKPWSATSPSITVLAAHYQVGHMLPCEELLCHLLGSGQT